jgi:hypothetical protein
MDFGFASSQYLKTSFSKTCDVKKYLDFNECQKQTFNLRFNGNQFDDASMCCLYNVSSNNPNFKNDWYRTQQNIIISERLCYNSKYNNITTEKPVYIEFPWDQLFSSE